MSDYPEHAKLLAVSDDSQAIGAFLDNLGEGMAICRWRDATGAIWDEDYEPAGFYPDHKSIQDRLAEYFDIDQDKIETEKRRMIDELREANAKP